MKKFVSTALVVVLLLAMALTTVYGATVKVGTFTSQSSSVKDIGTRLPVVEIGIPVDSSEYSNTDVAVSVAYASDFFNQDGFFIRGGVELDKTYAIGNPKAKVSPYAGGGIGLFYTNGVKDSTLNFGGSLIGGVKLGDAVFVETKYTDVRAGDLGDGFTFSFGARF